MTIRRRRSPDVPMLRRYLDRGLTHRQIAVEWERETGMRVSTSAISAACSRAGLTRRVEAKSDLPAFLAERDWVLPNGERLR